MTTSGATTRTEQASGSTSVNRVTPGGGRDGLLCHDQPCLLQQSKVAVDLGTIVGLPALCVLHYMHASNSF